MSRGYTEKKRLRILFVSLISSGELRYCMGLSYDLLFVFNSAVIRKPADMKRCTIVLK